MIAQLVDRRAARPGGRRGGGRDRARGRSPSAMILLVAVGVFGARRRPRSSPRVVAALPGDRARGRLPAARRSSRRTAGSRRSASPWWGSPCTSRSACCCGRRSRGRCWSACCGASAGSRTSVQPCVRRGRRPAPPRAAPRARSARSRRAGRCARRRRGARGRARARCRSGRGCPCSSPRRHAQARRARARPTSWRRKSRYSRLARLRALGRGSARRNLLAARSYVGSPQPRTRTAGRSAARAPARRAAAGTRTAGARAASPRASPRDARCPSRRAPTHRSGAPVAARNPAHAPQSWPSRTRALDPEDVEERRRVLGEARLAEVAVGRRAGPAEPAEVHGQEADVGQQRDDAPPDPPVVREAVQGDDRGPVLAPAVGDVDPDAGRQIVVAVHDAVERGWLHARTLRSLAAMSDDLACWTCGTTAVPDTRFPNLGYVRCPACDLVFAPSSSQERLRELYGEAYFEDYGLEGTYDADADQRRREAQVRVRWVREAGPPIGRLLEIGCASGWFLGEARAVGYEVVGIEPAEEMAAAARERSGAEVHAAMLEDASLDPGSFDVAVAWHVLEHLARPRDTLAGVRTALRPGGCLLLELPNIASLRATRQGEDWYGMEPAHHVAHYSPDGARRAAARLGLRARGRRERASRDAARRARGVRAARARVRGEGDADRASVDARTAPLEVRPAARRGARAVGVRPSVRRPQLGRPGRAARVPPRADAPDRGLRGRGRRQRLGRRDRGGGRRGVPGRRARPGSRRTSDSGER